MLDIEVTPRAAIQLEAAAAWWLENRPAAPVAIRVDFQDAITLLSRQPGVGAKSSMARYPRVAPAVPVKGQVSRLLPRAR